MMLLVVLVMADIVNLVILVTALVVLVAATTMAVWARIQKERLPLLSLVGEKVLKFTFVFPHRGALLS